MIHHAIDTNVLVRIIVADDDKQTKQAIEYVATCGEVLISHVVLCEFSWVVITSYHFSKSELLHVLEHILQTKQFYIENSDTVWKALNEYKKSNADFSDCLLGAIAKHYGENEILVGTFDKKASRSSFFELIA